MADQDPNPTSPVPIKVTVTDVADHETDPLQEEKLRALGRIQAGETDHFWSSLAAGILDMFAVVIAQAAQLWDFLMKLVASLFLAAQGENSKVFWELSGLITEDLTGVRPDIDKLKEARFGSGRLAGMTELGAGLFNQLRDEFQKAGKGPSEANEAAAHAFMGFLMNFAIRQGNVAVISEAIPESLNMMKGFREYGELMAKNLGLGRLARRALTPLIQTMVSDPLQWSLNAQYTPTRLEKGELIKAFFHGEITEEVMRKELTEAGYSKDRQDSIIRASRAILTESQIVDLYFRQNNPLDATLLALQQRGWQGTEGNILIDLHRPQLEKNEIIHLYEGGEIELPEALGLLAQLGYDDKTAHRVITAYELAHQPSVKLPKFHTKHLSLGELRKAYIDTNIDLFEFQDYLTRLGYSADDVQILTLDLLVDAKKHTDLEAARAARDAAKGTKTKPTP